MRKTTKVVPNTTKKPPRAGMGRPKGAKNKTTKALKEMILGALEDVGGQAYLAKQAEENPGPFMTLIGKVLPMSIKGDIAHTLTSRVVEVPADE